MATDDIARLYDFEANTTIVSDQVDQEFNQIVQTINNKVGRSVDNSFSGANSFSGSSTFSGNVSFSSGTATFANGIIISRASDPSLTTGVVWFDNSADLLKFYDGSATKTVATSDDVKYPKGYLAGPAPLYQSASTVRIPQGFACRDDGDDADIYVSSNLDVVLSGAGALGLDTGSEASNTWYYLWLIRKSSDGTVSAIFSTSSSSPTMPADYDQKRLLPIAVRNDTSSDIIPFRVSGRRVYYETTLPFGNASVATSVMINGTASSYTDIDCSGRIPPNSRLSGFHIRNTSGGAWGYIRPNGATNEHCFGMSQTAAFNRVEISTDASQIIEYKRDGGSGDVEIDVAWFEITEYTNGY